MVRRYVNSAVVALLSLSCTVAGVALEKRSSVPGFDYQNDKIRGVNLGSWFILEPYMTPSFFQDGFASSDIPVDEYHLTQAWGKEKSESTLSKHWDTWITEQDIQQIASWGLNTVRIPIGYWAYIARPQDPYVQGQDYYLERALGWARDAGLKVWIDLHGVPGSQNGFDNSGLRGVIDWQDDQYPENMQGSYDALDIITRKYATPDWYDVVIGIELVNEPLGPVLSMDKLHTYYNNGWGKVHNFGSNGVILHDAFKPPGFMNDWLTVDQGYWNVVIDHHQYQVFDTSYFNMDFNGRIQTACNTGRAFDGESHWRVVGEWSAALTDCAPLVNGVYRGARFDGTYESDKKYGSCSWIQDYSQWPDWYRTQTRQFVEAQLDAWERSSGWIIWAYKTENLIDWDLGQLIGHGLFPQPPTDRQFPNQCGY